MQSSKNKAIALKLFPFNQAIMNNPKLARATNILSNSAKFIILKVRKFKFLGWIYLIIFAWLAISALTRPEADQIANSENIYGSNPNSNPPSIVANSAVAKAYKTGNEVTIRWDKPVFDTSFRADGRRIAEENVNCQLDFCLLNLSEEIDSLKVRWTENGDLFSKEFRFN